jgi:hypothetical protein
VTATGSGETVISSGIFSAGKIKSSEPPVTSKTLETISSPETASYVAIIVDAS